MSEQLMRKWTEGFAAADWDKVASTYADDVIVSDPTGSTYEGKEANLENDKGWRSTFSDFNFDFKTFHTSGNTTAVEFEITATMTGEMQMPDGSKIPATNKTHTMSACGVMETENNLIKNNRIYNVFCHFSWSRLSINWYGERDL